MTLEHDDYCRDFLARDVVEKLEAGAFRSLCQHLQERSDTVANMELMSLSGFCRNCLAKWMVLEARRIVDDPNESMSIDASTKEALNAMGYAEAAQHVYGMTYDDWKKRFQKKATAEQMERYEASKPIQAKHNKELLEPRGEKPAVKLNNNQVPAPTAGTTRSNVCCQDVEEVAATTTNQQNHHLKAARDTRILQPYQPPPMVEAVEKLKTKITALKVGILTVSDRASKNEYDSGDLSGPAVQNAIQQLLENTGLTDVSYITVIVPDEVDAIQSQLQAWCDDDTNAMHLALTTGGTGLSPRDVTPEAVKPILDVEASGLMNFVTAECAKLQPLSSLSRGTAGIRKNTLIANLPGNPKGVGEIMPLLLPLLFHALADL